MKKAFVCILLFAVACLCQAEGLGISSKLYAERFNGFAKEMQTDYRLRSDRAKVTKGPKTTSVRIDLDRLSSILLIYEADKTKMSGVTLFRELGGDKMQSLDAMTLMLLTAMSAFENPRAIKVPDLTVDACLAAMKNTGSSHEKKVDGKTISCSVINGVLMLWVH